VDRPRTESYATLHSAAGHESTTDEDGKKDNLGASTTDSNNCDICFEHDVVRHDGDDTNDGEQNGRAIDSLLVRCTQCSISVHPTCYGHPLVKMRKEQEDQERRQQQSRSSSSVRDPLSTWVCDRCLWKAEQEPCVLCPILEGPMKRTTDWRWVHLVCALWIPEVFFRVPLGRQAVDVLHTKTTRFALECVFCHKTEGACLPCSHPSCELVFHVTCGLQNDIYIEYKQNTRGADVVMAFCEEHGKRWAHSQGRRLKTLVHT